MSDDRRAEMLRRCLTRFDGRIRLLEARSGRYVRARIALFLAAVVAIPLPLPSGVLVPFLAAVAAAFFVVARYHRRIDRTVKLMRRWREIRAEQLARLELDWDRIPAAGSVPDTAGHPYAQDLGILGATSIHRLLDTSVSKEGSRRLAAWLLDQYPDLQNSLLRQRRVRALQPLHRFRDRLLLAFRMVSREPLDGDGFLRWLRDTELPRRIRWLLPLSAVMALINILLFLAWGFSLLPPWFVLTVFAYLSVYFLNARVRETFLSEAIVLDIELGRLKAVFRFLEEYRVGESEVLVDLLSPLRGADSPTAAVRSVLRKVVAAGVSMNPVTMMLLNGLAPWDFYFAWSLEKERRRLAERMPAWLDALHELEALLSLAHFAWLHPSYSFPRLTDETDGPVVKASALAHVLIPAAQNISNDVLMKDVGDVHMITGSNMAGKSTFLRTVGSSLCLAYAGTVVNAEECTARMLRIRSCIQISDSLREGVSYFYAEVRRLKAILDDVRDTTVQPVLFLVDEIFKGTNNIERRTGSRAYIQAVAGQHGVGLVSTHDIELTTLAAELPRLSNFHFREEVHEGRMRFDYLLREGPCPTTNALVIMRAEGLPVPE